MATDAGPYKQCIVMDCTQMNGNILSKIENDKSWDDASLACQKIPGGKLASIRNFEEFSKLVSFAGWSKTGNIWIGYNDCKY